MVSITIRKVGGPIRRIGSVAHRETSDYVENAPKNWRCISSPDTSAYRENIESW